jgi:Flp pilus assembly protein TadG
MATPHTRAADARPAASRRSPSLGRTHRPPATGWDDRGSALVWLLLLLPVLFAFAGLVLDGGRVITARQHAANLAEQAARQAVDQLDRGRFRETGNAVGAVDPPAAAAAACRYTASAAPGAGCTVTVDTDGQVRVAVTISTPTALLAAVGISRLTVTGTGQSRPAVGVTQEVQP